MSVRALATALRALAPSGVNLHIGTVTDAAPALPWLVLNVSVPNVTSRSLARSRQALTGRLLGTVAATNEDAALSIIDKVIEAYEGARPVAAGWSLGPIEQLGDVHVYPDDVVIANANRRVMVAKITFQYTATRRP